jgi:WD40 repeat protein
MTAIGDGRYRMIELIGQGGMGRVWRARDESLGRDVAVKQLLFPPHLDESTRKTLIQRAIGEARAAARLRHEGIVTVHTIVEHEGAPWIVMELIDGPSLSPLVTGGVRPDWRRIATLGAQVADALAHAHAEGVVHRDLKPENILLAGDRPVITDFGIALLLDATARLTGSHAIIGTPQFMAPEQFQGREITGVSDMWALGATLYAVLEGRVPFDGPSPAAIITAVLTEPFAPPQHAGPLDQIISALLDKDPERRPRAEAVAADLRFILQRVDRPTEMGTAPQTLPGTGTGAGAGTGADVGTGAGRTGPSRRTILLGGAGLVVAAAGGTAAALLRGGGGGPAAWTYVPLTGYSGYVYSLSFSPDGKTLVGGCDDHGVRLWDVATGALVADLTGHTGAVRVVAFSPDGGLIASGSTDQTVRIWDASSHAALTTISPYVEVADLAFSPDGKTLATSGQADSISLWDLTNDCAYLTMLFGSNLGGYAIAYSPDGRVVADGGLMKNVVLFDASNDKQLGALDLDSELGATHVAFSPDSKTLATANFPVDSKKGSMASVIQLFDVTARTLTATLTGHTDIVRAAVFSPDGTTLASGSDDATVRLWDVATRRTTHQLPAPGGAGTVAFKPDGGVLAVGGKAPRLWWL